MGFIEDLGKQKMQEAQARSTAWRNAEEKRISSLEKTKAQERELLEREKQSQLEYELSGIPSLLKRLGNASGISDRGNYDVDGNRLNKKDGNCLHVIEISKQEISSDQSKSVSRVAFFEIIVDWMGTVTFKGSSLFGTSIIGKSRWIKDESVLENALGKAYLHPQRRTRVYTYRSEPMN